MRSKNEGDVINSKKLVDVFGEPLKREGLQCEAWVRLKMKFWQYQDKHESLREWLYRKHFIYFLLCLSLTIDRIADNSDNSY